MRPVRSLPLLAIVVATALKWFFLSLYLLAFLIWYPFAWVKLKLYPGSSADSTVVSPWDETATPAAHKAEWSPKGQTIARVP
jgi:hypothetical protein